jgi:hypothetical protein
MKCSSAAKRKREMLNEKLLNVSEEVSDVGNTILRYPDKALIIDAGRHLDKGECKWFNKIEYI